MSWDEDACYETSLDIPSGKYGKLIAIPGGPGPSGPAGPEGPVGPAGPVGPEGPEGSLDGLSEIGQALATAPDAGSAQDVLDVYSREQSVGSGDELPNECGFVWVSEPVAVNGRVFLGTIADDQGSWLQEWTQPVEGGPFWLHRYYLGRALVSKPQAALVDAKDLRDDHNPAAVAVKSGKPVVAFWSGHGSERRFYYRVSDQIVDDAPAGGLTFGPTQTLELPADFDGFCSYTQVMINGDDIWVGHRSGWNANQWCVTKFPAWASGTPTTVRVVDSVDQAYVKFRMFNGVIRCAANDHASSATGSNKLWWAEINCATGAVTKSDGTVLGNLDGTNLPLPQASLELVHTSAGSDKPWAWDIGYGATKEIAFVDGPVASFGANGKYKYARLNGAAWSVSTICNVGFFINSSGAYFPSIVFVPENPKQVLLVRSTGTPPASVHYVEKYSTTDGVAWALDELVDSSPVNISTKSPRMALNRVYAVRNEVGSAPFDVFITDYLDYPYYDQGWVSHIRPAPLSHPVKRFREDSPIVRGMKADLIRNPAPSSGLYLSGTSGDIIEGPTTALPAEGFRLEVDVALPDWTPAAGITLFGKEDSNSKREMRLFLNLNGRLGLYWSEDGSTSKFFQPTCPALPFANWQRAQIAVEFIPSLQDSTVTYTACLMSVMYRLSDTDPWTLRASERGTGTSLFSSDSKWTIGGRQGTQELAEGVYYRASVMTLGRRVLAEWRADRGAIRQRDVAGNVWATKTVGGGSSGTDSVVLKNPRIDNAFYTPTGMPVLQLQSTATAAGARWLLNQSSDVTPSIAATGAGADITVAVVPKGTGAFRVYATTPTVTMQGWSAVGNANFNLSTQSIGVVQINGTQVEVKGHKHVAADVTGALSWAAAPASATAPGTAGQLAYANGFIYVCVAANTWQRAPLAAW